MRDPQLYGKANNLQRNDVKRILEQNVIKWKAENARVLDIGCGDGSVTINFFKNNMPENFMKLVGSDKNQNAVEYAQEHYGGDKIQFVTLDIEGKVPDEFQGSFDHILSSYTFHWVRQQETAFTNVYNMLAEGGTCLIMFLGRASIFEVYEKLSHTPKWKEDLKHVRTGFISPYFDSQDPAGEIRSIMLQIGFKDIDVKVPHRTFTYDGGVDELKQLMKSINPFDSLKAKWDDFMNDYVELDPCPETFTYQLIIAYGSK